MTDGSKILICGLICVGLGAVSQTFAAQDSETYRGIVERNVFNLKPPTPAVPVEPPAPPPPKAILTGIFTILGPKRTGLKLAIPARPPEPAREESYLLGEGQRQGNIEVLQIDEVLGTVKINNHGTIQSLNFTNDGAKLVAVAAPMVAPQHSGAIPVPGQANPGGPNASALRNIPARTMRPTGAQPNASPDMPNNVVPGGMPATSTAYPAQPQAQNGRPPMSYEEQVIMMEVQRQRTQEQVRQGRMPPLPPTVLTPQEGVTAPDHQGPPPIPQ